MDAQVGLRICTQNKCEALPRAPGYWKQEETLRSVKALRVNIDGETQITFEAELANPTCQGGL